MRSSRILVSIPSISIDNFPDLGWTPAEFQKTSTTLDCFKSELEGIKVKKLWGVNIPHFSLADHGACGVVGPSKPFDELFYPPEIGERMSMICGTYDKWRPYPAEVMSPYTVQIAVKFARKRCKLFKHVAENMDWDALFYVEHSPSSLAHLDKEVAQLIAKDVMESVVKVAEQWPSVPLVIFSPYGTNGENGFIVSNLQEVDAVGTWDWIREFINGSSGDSGW
jgi:hypothetical protein